MHVYEVRPRKDHRGFDLISDVLPFGRLLCGEAERDQQSNSLFDTTAKYVNFVIDLRLRSSL